jgi:hypothetical protein
MTLLDGRRAMAALVSGYFMLFDEQVPTGFVVRSRGGRSL